MVLDKLVILKPYRNTYLPENKVRDLIHRTDIKTFPRPKGIPENYRVKISKNGRDIKYVHPTDEGTYIRIMPEKPHSPNPCQQKPYINRRINGKSVDNSGNFVEKKSIESHIPLEEFIYRNN